MSSESQRNKEEDQGSREALVLDAMLELSETQLLAQIADETSLDGRTMGLLAFNGALLAADIGAKGVLGVFWWTPLPAVAISAALCLWSIFEKDSDFGPQPVRFYATYGGLAPQAASAQLLADLDDAFANNAGRVRIKGGLLRWALGVLTAGLAAAALLIGLDRPSNVKNHVTPSESSTATRAAGSHAGPGTVPGASRRPRRGHPFQIAGRQR